ncbi:Putative ribonuclease H protein At1g65750 [Linum perenne]
MGEASVEQAAAILDCLDKFCDASGQTVSKEKSVCFCSKNTGRQLAAAIATALEIPLTLDLGKYLGVPVLHERTSTRTYQGVIDRIEQKLTGWKAKTLSLAGRVTLAQAVLSAIPAYVMQTAVLPVATCEAIDRKIKNFVWGSSDEARKVHLVAWETVCTPKEEGELGLKSARFLNRAYMNKLAFKFLQEPEKLWVKVLQSKYFKETTGGAVNMVMGMTPPQADRGDDEWVWGEEVDGQFSIKSAYRIVCSLGCSSLADPWLSIWKWKGPNRARLFLWLAIHEKIMTNTGRKRRNLTNDDRTLGLQDWLCFFLKSEGGLLFGAVCWFLWKARNNRVFGGEAISSVGVAHQASIWVRDSTASEDRNGLISGHQRPRVMTEIAWDPGPPGWLSLNTDGSFDRNRQGATTGGLLRDEYGRCLFAFTMNLGLCSITRAELRGAVEGLKRAWEAGYRRIMLRLDSRAAISLLTADRDTSHQHGMEVLQYQELCRRNWLIQIKHTYREGNHAADFLASLGYDYPRGSHTISTTDSNLGYFLRYDCMGISEPRSILIND